MYASAVVDQETETGHAEWNYCIKKTSMYLTSSKEKELGLSKSNHMMFKQEIALVYSPNSRFYVANGI